MTVGRVVPVLNIIKDRSTNMYRVLITDDEKIEREGIKFLLAQEEGEYEIHEAANGRQALNVLRSEDSSRKYLRRQRLYQISERDSERAE